jgi:prepilin-type processing-associated H-X9-DG protein/prepilin-type N-terminal cleavage/methylation domain-containing protein
MTMIRRNAFTLIELLVVISIIALLISILLPALSRARELAYRTVCRSNQGTLCLASHMYADSCGELFVPIRMSPDVCWFENRLFRDSIGLVNKKEGETEDDDEPDSEMYTMPDEYSCLSDIRTVDMEDPINRGIMSYGYNITGWDFDAMPFVTRNRLNIEKPSTKVMFMDAHDWMVTSEGANYMRYWDRYGPVQGYLLPNGRSYHGNASYRHNEGANVAFFDGHVEHLWKDEVYPMGKTFEETDENVAELWDAGGLVKLEAVGGEPEE